MTEQTGSTGSTRPSAQTREFERAEASTAHEPDRMPTPEEEAVAESQQMPEGAAEHYQEMGKIGANAKGEGRIDAGE